MMPQFVRISNIFYPPTRIAWGGQNTCIRLPWYEIVLFFSTFSLRVIIQSEQVYSTTSTMAKSANVNNIKYNTYLEWVGILNTIHPFLFELSPSCDFYSNRFVLVIQSYKMFISKSRQQQLLYFTTSSFITWRTRFTDLVRFTQCRPSHSHRIS